MVLIFTVISYSSAWWILDYLHDCSDDVHLVVYVRYGVCGVSQTGGISKNDCIKWSEGQKWDEIDNQSNSHTNTRYDADVTYPVANGFIITGIVISVLQLLVCGLYAKWKAHVRRLQYIAIFLNVVYVLLTFWAGMTGGKSDVVLESTWSAYTPCKDGYSYPFTAYYALSIACVSSGVILLFAVVPGHMSCLHLVDYDNEEYPGGTGEGHSGMDKSVDACADSMSPVHAPPVTYEICNDSWGVVYGVKVPSLPAVSAGHPHSPPSSDSSLSITSVAACATDDC